ncbi:MAG: hypothetical protein U1E45_24170 [Geminicoccaceae bacterium]
MSGNILANDVRFAVFVALATAAFAIATPCCAVAAKAGATQPSELQFIADVDASTVDLRPSVKLRVSAGDLDTSFSRDGKVQTEFTDGGQATALVLQSDGKIVAAGFAARFVGHVWIVHTVVARYFQDGRRDPGFGRDGRVELPCAGSVGWPRSVKIQRDGTRERILIGAGCETRPGNGNFDFTLVRLNENGSVDRSFGNGAGTVQTNFGTRDGKPSLDELDALVVQEDGKVVAGGATSLDVGTRMALARYTADGALDPSFGDNGRLVFGDNVFPWNADVLALAIQRDRKIVGTGFRETNTGTRAVLFRLNRRGRLDDSFGTGGVVVRSFGPNFFTIPTSILIQSDDRIVIGGYYSDPSDEEFRYHGFVARYLGSGVPDYEFAKGLARLTIGNLSFFLQAMSEQVDGKYVLAGGLYSSNRGQLVMARLDVNGRLDPTFGTGGVVLTRVKGNGAANAIQVQPNDGRLIVAGVRDQSSVSASFFLARYHALTCGGYAVTLAGTRNAEALVGTSDDDVIFTSGGADKIKAGAGNDVICAGTGNDRIDGGGGVDWCDGGGGTDTATSCETRINVP